MSNGNQPVMIGDTSTALADNLLPAQRHPKRLDEIARAIIETQHQGALRIGALLHEARQLFRYKRDENGFLAWIDRRLSMSKSTAYELVHVFERFGSDKNVSATVETLPTKVLHAIAAPKMPEHVRTEVIQRAERGEPVTIWDVKELKHAAQQAAEEAKLPPKKRAPIKAKKEAAQAALVRREAEAELLHQRKLAATQASAASVISMFGAKMHGLQEVLKDAYPEDFYNTLMRAKSPETGGLQ